MTKRKDLSKALDQVENSKGTHHAIDFKPANTHIYADGKWLEAGPIATLSKLMILYMDLRTQVKHLMELHDFRQEPETDVHPSDSEWFEALMRVDAAMNALRDFEAGMAVKSPIDTSQQRDYTGAPGIPVNFAKGGVSFDVGNEPSVTVEVVRDEAGNIIDSYDKYKEWQKRAHDRPEISEEDEERMREAGIQ